MPDVVRIEFATSEVQYEAFTALVREYLAFLPFSVSFQDTERELAEISTRYGEVGRGAALLAVSGEVTVGIAGLRDIGDNRCELKRMYVRLDWRRQGIARQLSERALVVARWYGYDAVRLDTLRSMNEAAALYRSLGFVDIPAYRVNPLKDAVYLELGLHADAMLRE